MSIKAKLQVMLSPSPPKHLHHCGELVPIKASFFITLVPFPLDPALPRRPNLQPRPRARPPSAFVPGNDLSAHESAESPPFVVLVEYLNQIFARVCEDIFRSCYQYGLMFQNRLING